jgi:ABC-2 type transport system permease protein
LDQLIAIVTLRWRTDLRALLRSRGRTAAAALAVPFMLLLSGVLGLLVFGGLRALDRGSPEALLAVVSAAATGFGILAVLSPLMSGLALAESHDVSRLLPYPVSSWTLAAASLVSNLARPAAMTQVPVLLAASVAVSRSVAAVPLVVAGFLESWLLVVSGAHIGALILHGLARHRRLHDLFLVVGLVLGFLLSVLPFLLLVSERGPALVAAALRGAASTGIFALSPYGWGARAGVHAGRGEILPFLLFAALGALAQAGAVAVEAVLIERIHRGDLVLGAAASPRYRARMPFPGALGALVEKDLRTAWRDPALRTVFVMGLAGPLLLFFVLTRGGARLDSHAPLFLMASFVGLSTFGAGGLALERRGLGLLFSFPVERWRILVAKNVAMLSFRLPGLLGLLVCALAFAPLADVPGAVAIAAVTLLFCAAADNFLSVLFPVTVPAPGQDPYTSRRRRGAGGMLVGMVFLLAAVAGSAPFVFLVWLPPLLGAPWLSLAAIPLALAGAGAVYGMLVAGAGRLLTEREGDLLQFVLGES